MEMLQGVWKQHLRPRAVVGYGVKIFLPSPPNYVTRSPGWRYLDHKAKSALVSSYQSYIKQLCSGHTSVSRDRSRNPCLESPFFPKGIYPGYPIKAVKGKTDFN